MVHKISELLKAVNNARQSGQDRRVFAALLDLYRFITTRRNVFITKERQVQESTNIVINQNGGRGFVIKCHSHCIMEYHGDESRAKAAIACTHEVAVRLFKLAIYKVRDIEPYIKCLEDMAALVPSSTGLADPVEPELLLDMLTKIATILMPFNFERCLASRSMGQRPEPALCSRYLRKWFRLALRDDTREYYSVWQKEVKSLDAVPDGLADNELHLQGLGDVPFPFRKTTDIFPLMNISELALANRFASEVRNLQKNSVAKFRAMVTHVFTACGRPFASNKHHKGMEDNLKLKHPAALSKSSDGLQELAPISALNPMTGATMDSTTMNLLLNATAASPHKRSGPRLFHKGGVATLPGQVDVVAEIAVKMFVSLVKLLVKLRKSQESKVAQSPTPMPAEAANPGKLRKDGLPLSEMTNLMLAVNTYDALLSGMVEPSRPVELMRNVLAFIYVQYVHHDTKANVAGFLVPVEALAIIEPDSILDAQNCILLSPKAKAKQTQRKRAKTTVTDAGPQDNRAYSILALCTSVPLLNLVVARAWTFCISMALLRTRLVGQDPASSEFRALMNGIAIHGLGYVTCPKRGDRMPKVMVSPTDFHNDGKHDKDKTKASKNSSAVAVTTTDDNDDHDHDHDQVAAIVEQADEGADADPVNKLTLFLEAGNKRPSPTKCVSYWLRYPFAIAALAIGKFRLIKCVADRMGHVPVADEQAVKEARISAYARNDTVGDNKYRDVLKEASKHLKVLNMDPAKMVVYNSFEDALKHGKAGDGKAVIRLPVSGASDPRIKRMKDVALSIARLRKLPKLPGLPEAYVPMAAPTALTQDTSRTAYTNSKVREDIEHVMEAMLDTAGLRDKATCEVTALALALQGIRDALPMPLCDKLSVYMPTLDGALAPIRASGSA
jgi:hypothetical protein